MFPTVNGLGQNIALAMRGRERRQQFQSAHPSDTSLGRFLDQVADTRWSGSPWDAFTEGLEETHDAADAAGMKFKVGTTGFGNLRPSLIALTKAQAMDAAANGAVVAGDDTHGYTRQFGARLSGY